MLVLIWINLHEIKNIIEPKTQINTITQVKKDTLHGPVFIMDSNSIRLKVEKFNDWNQ